MGRNPTLALPGLDRGPAWVGRESPGAMTTLAPAGADVLDTADDRIDHPLLQAALLACGELLAPAYRQADAAALRMQRSHRRVVLTTATLGTAAIVVALLELLPWTARAGSTAIVVDAVFTLVAAAAVLLGIVASLQQRWYLYRHRAELLRLLKYRSLIALATGSELATFAEWRTVLSREVERICAVDRTMMNAWTHGADADGSVRAAPVSAAAMPAVNALRDYYMRKRLAFQRAYFSTRAKQYQATDKWLRAAPPLLFLASVAFASAHFAIAIAESLHHSNRAASHTGEALIVISAICVVTGGMIRTLRSANEYARNTLRFRAKYITLESLSTRLGSATPANAVTFLLETERILEEEHREWLRLMREADWFG